MFVCERKARELLFVLRVSATTIITIIIIGPKRDEVTGEWRKLYNEELHDLYSSPNIVWVIK
jgi:hypothetical protein